jgi:hypothetical protein
MKLKKNQLKRNKKINRVNLDQPIKPATRSWDYDSLTESKLKKKHDAQLKGKENNEQS